MSKMKIEQDNDMIACTSAVYAENDTELSCLIGPRANCDKNHIWQLRD